MKKYVILAICGFFLVITQCTQVPSSEGAAKIEMPRISAGHGAIFNNGKAIVPDEKFTLQAQSTMLAFVEAQIGKNEKLEDKLSLIKKHVKNEVLRNALMIDEMILTISKTKNKKLKGVQVSRLKLTNDILRSYYVHRIQKNPILPESNKDWFKGLEEEIAAILESAGIRVSLATNAGGEEYLAECLEALVPVPENVFGSDGWQNLGEFDNEFIIPGGVSELWIYRSDDPPGVCLALPRYEGNEADALGMICLNTQNGNTCFFDNDTTVFFERGVNHSIDDFIGGSELWNGVCTDCHGGENPFVVHADTNYVPFRNLSVELMSETWYRPLVVEDWPQNPEPEFDLSSIVGDRNCTDCHVKAGAGRLPMHLDELPGYCNAVFNQAVKGFHNWTGVVNPNGPTMPPNMDNLCEYAEQVNYMLRECNLPEIEPCEDDGFEDFFLECGVNVVCEIFEEIERIPDFEVGCEVIDCCEGCPNFEDYLDVIILWRSDVIKSLHVTSISEKGEKISKTIYNDQTFRVRLKRSQKDIKNVIDFSASSEEDYPSIAKQIQSKKIDNVGKIIVTQLMDNRIASTRKLMLKIKK